MLVYDDVNEWKTEYQQSVNGQVNHAWSLLPPMIKRLLPSMSASIDPLHFWRMKHVSLGHALLSLWNLCFIVDSNES